jgi:hypothetical protein
MSRGWGLRSFNRLWDLAGRLLKPVGAGWRRLPRLWALITGRKASGASLYRQDFSGLDLEDLLLAINRELPDGKKGGTGKRAYYPTPGTARVSGSFL